MNRRTIKKAYMGITNNRERQPKGSMLDKYKNLIKEKDDYER